MRVRAFGWVLLLAASSLFAGAAAPSHPGGQARPDLVQIADRTLLPDLEASGAARVIADYGSYVLAETDPAEAATLQASGRGEPRGDYRFVMLNAGWIDTSSEEARVSSDSVGSFSGKRLHLIHFVGPVQNDWYHALEATGVRVITYIPSNSYLVYGDMASLARLQRMARRSPFVSWQGAYGGTQKVAAVIPEREARGESMPSLYAVQLVKDAQANGDTLALLDSLRQGEFFSTYEILDYVNIITGLDSGPHRGTGRTARRGLHPAVPDSREERRTAGHDRVGQPRGFRAFGPRLSGLAGRQGLYAGPVCRFGLRGGCDGQRRGRRQPRFAQPLRPLRAGAEAGDEPPDLQPPGGHAQHRGHDPGLRRARDPQHPHPGRVQRPGGVPARGRIGLPLRAWRVPLRPGGLLGHFRSPMDRSQFPRPPLPGLPRRGADQHQLLGVGRGGGLYHRLPGL